MKLEGNEFQFYFIGTASIEHTFQELAEKDLVTGEGGSGGALAIGMGDVLIMLEYSIYSVISPEACSTILWRNPDEAESAAEAMGISSKRLNKLWRILSDL